VSALALVSREVPEFQEYLSVFPDCAKSRLFQVAAVEFEVAARLHDADMGDKAEGCSSQTASRHGIQAIGRIIDLFSPFVRFLPKNPVVMGSAGRFEVDRYLAPHIVKPVKQLFVLPRIDFLIGHVPCATCGDKQENVVGCGTELNGQLEHLFRLPDILSCDSRIDLKLDALIFKKLNALQCSFKSANHFSEMVMLFGILSVQGNAHPLYAGGLHPSRDFFCDQGSVCGHHHSEAFVGPIPGELENVLPQQGLTTCENNDRFSNFLDLVQDFDALGRVEFSFVRAPAGCSAAVHAIQVAVSRHLPRDEAKPVLVFKFSVHTFTLLNNIH
jgi:hypothetical protein